MIEGEGEEIARTTVERPGDLLTAVADAFRSSRVSREYRQLAAILPPDDSPLRTLRRRIGSRLETPPIRSKERRWLADAPALEVE